jgi:hypothetical protein
MRHCNCLEFHGLERILSLACLAKHTHWDGLRDLDWYRPLEIKPTIDYMINNKAWNLFKRFSSCMMNS